MSKCKITFLPDKKTCLVEKGQNILQAVISCGISINSSCGGEGVCGRCKVIVKKGTVYSEPTGRISPEERKKGYQLACLAIIESDLEVEIPPESRIKLEITTKEEEALRLKGLYSKAEEIQVTKDILGDIFIHSPLATKLYLELPQPTLDDKIGDLERLYREIRKHADVPIMQTGLANIRRLGEILRSSNWRVTATLGKRNGTTEIVLIEPQDTSKRNYGVAFDIGTTTISGQLVNLNTKKILGSKATYNPQVVFGGDIISRIAFANREEGLEQLHHAVIDTMNDMIKDLINENEVNLNDVTCVLCAGNTTMIHLLLRIDPTFIRREPYVSTASTVPVIRAAEAGIKINPRGLLACVPGVTSYVGGDITAGVLACGMADSNELTLLIDIGTNGEIVLGNKDWLICCAASAGPAFEGSGVACGTRATKGAIEKVKIDKKTFEVEYQTIADGGPVGICGSGYISCISEMLKAGILNKDGKLNTSFKTRRIRDLELGKEFVLIFKKEVKDLNYDIVITETDIDNLKRAKAAIFAATQILVNHLDLKLSDIKRIFIAGGFGTSLDIEKAISIGLLPDLDRKIFKFVGNTSLIGAHTILLSSEASKRTEGIAKKMTYFELSVDPKYMEEYMAALFFPHTDILRFPSCDFCKKK